MEDRYLFKAKRIDNGEWVIGSLVLSDDADEEYKAIIIPSVNSNMFTRESYNEDLGFENWYKVDQSTICQCTGLKDKNGKLIWENDITLRTSVTGTHKGKIIYSSDGSFCQKNFETTFENLLIHSESYFEVIGNIFDNKELLESEEK